MSNILHFVILAFSVFVYGILLFYAVVNFITLAKGKPKETLLLRDLQDKVVIVIPVRDDISIFNSLEHYSKLDYTNFNVALIDDSASDGYSNMLAEKCIDYGFLHFIRPKEKRNGRKGAAINYLLPMLKPYSPDFIVVMDSDHHPPRNFLKKAVSIIKTKHVNAVVGYQRHNLGTYGVFGKFYRISQSAGILSNTSRNRVGLLGLFGGSVSIFTYEWLLSERFDDTSITEDWEISLRGHIDGSFNLYVTDELYADCAIPKEVRWYVKQQMRWAEGTIADFKKHFKSMIFSKHLSLRGKVGLAYQGLVYLQSLAILGSMAIVLTTGYSPFHTSLPLSSIISVAAGVSWVAVYLYGAANEGVNIGFSDLLFAFLMIFAMSPVYAYSSLKGLLVRKEGWTVTKRRA